ncbi:hypothetical protein ACFFX0_28070 [Citricoccus parietis]|uniref:Uncharacterized protein n=1 Tax=Citricoccus parietis TaxID=592307 RepID=A0ABV5G7A7_9MICC
MDAEVGLVAADADGLAFTAQGQAAGGQQGRQDGEPFHARDQLARSRGSMPRFRSSRCLRTQPAR